MLKLLEAAPRIAGTMALSRVRGINFALLSLYEQEGVPTNSGNQSAAYIDLDDTLILNGRVSVELAAFLYSV